MATAWQTLEEAALTLGISSRTLHRRLAKNEFETRLANGRREVLITLPDPIGVTDGSAEGSNPSVIIPDPVRQSSDDVQDTMLMLHEDRIRRTDLAIMAYQQSVSTSATAARRATINSRIAWSTVGGLAIMLFLSVIWATHRVTRAQAEVEHLNNEVRQLSDTSTQVSRQADTLRQTAESAKVTAARAEGELAATRQQVDQLNQQVREIRASASTQPAQAASVSKATVSATQPATTQPVMMVDQLLQLQR